MTLLERARAAACAGHTTACVGGPLITVSVQGTGGRREVAVCVPCIAVWRQMGADIREVAVPEWRRRLEAKDMTGADLWPR